ncbi:probably inactive leucine-rich repeat receptor-like protein kinase IMK2 [Punica granatum]|uniref:Probably inactive leucine-rich repeat receptor-like protein kinase IMK2 n=1 Tax=Punica granatum TaxID=22663 RepID=A0A218W3I0_PUNGR|nr:probably inactive leucine-rich repeat receptor-like protein kinase IMK2 [Punica granatum]OWM67089.1 hypothetical protein CDL15_Pgr000541 [Punica granatum]
MVESRNGVSRNRLTPRNSLCFLFFLFLAVPIAPSSSSREWDGVIVTQADYQALLAIRSELVDPHGVLRSWNGSALGACSGGWAGIKCAQGQVIVIQLPWKGLGGRISEKIAQLGALRRLSLHDNSLTGVVPQSLGFLPYLRGVHLFNNRLLGSVPPSLGNCPLLQALDLRNNLLSGPIPPAIANSTKLMRLDLSSNSLTGSIPVGLTRSPSIAFLALERNNLSGPIPDSWGGVGNSTYLLTTLTLDHNRISGSIPPSLGKLGLLQKLSMSHNQIGGAIPDELGRLSRLRELDLSFNSVNGSLPASFPNMSSLVVLNLEGNQLRGLLPDALDRLLNLSMLNLSNNKFQGKIPSTIGNMSSISKLDLSENNFTGEIPSSLQNLANLNSFNVSYNNLSGPVPSRLSEKFNASSFVGNIQLCGYSSSTPCPNSPPPQSSISPSAEPSMGSRKRKLTTKDIILIAAGILLAILLVLCCIVLCCLFRKKAAAKKKNGKPPASTAISEKAGSSGMEVESGGDAGGKLVHFDGPFVFAADDLLCATAEIMGKSSYGTAYKATLEDGHQVAVKRLREKTTKSQKEFENEVAVLGRIRHPNLLALRAYYLGPKREKLLVFDYMPKGSLASFLHARGPETSIDWPTRRRIAIGVARGLNHLHTQENMVHGNLTSSNVLLDEQVNAHIADYGLSRLMSGGAATMVATAGALGYAAPELSKTKKPTNKTDVYSLGVIVLELLTGKSPSEGTSGRDLPQWVASLVKEEWTTEVFDLELMRDATAIGDELLNTLKLALHCVDPSPTSRPEVQEVLQQLEEIMPEASAEPGNEGTEVPAPMVE